VSSYDKYNNRRFFGVDTAVPDFVVTVTMVNTTGCSSATVYTTSSTPNVTLFQVNNPLVLSLSWNTQFSYYAIRFVGLAPGNYTLTITTATTPTPLLVTSKLVTRLRSPTVSKIFPDTGKTTGGTLVTLLGTNFYSNPSLGTVYTRCVINGTLTNATMVVFSATMMVCYMPAASNNKAGTIIVQVNNDNGASLSSTSQLFIYNDPMVIAISPTAAPLVGGTVVTIRPPAAWLAAGNGTHIFYDTTRSASSAAPSSTPPSSTRRR
jgi:hypothetical protein